MTQSTLFNLHINEYIQGLCDYLFAFDLDRCFVSCNTLNHLFKRVCLPSKIKNLNLSGFSMIIEINELKILAKYISCECKYKFDGKKCNSNRKWNNDCWLSAKIRKNIMCAKKIIF